MVGLNRFGLQFLAISSGFALIGASCWNANTSNVLLNLILVIPAIISTIISMALVLLAFLPVSELHSPKSAILHFIMTVVFDIVGKIQLRRCLKATKDPRKVQTDVLLHILYVAKDSDFGIKNKLSQIKTIDEFRQRMPLTNYENYREYIDRIADNGLFCNISSIFLNYWVCFR